MHSNNGRADEIHAVLHRACRPEYRSFYSLSGDDMNTSDMESDLDHIAKTNKGWQVVIRATKQVLFFPYTKDLFIAGNGETIEGAYQSAKASAINIQNIAYTKEGRDTGCVEASVYGTGLEGSVLE